MWQKKEANLKPNTSMIRQVIPEFTDKKGHSFYVTTYMKQDIISVTEEYPNLDMIGNVRYDSVMYDLPHKPTGCRGSPAKQCRKLSIETDLTLLKLSAFDTSKKSYTFYKCRQVINILLMVKYNSIWTSITTFFTYISIYYLVFNV